MTIIITNVSGGKGGQGKTPTSTNTAKKLAQLGNKVLFIEGDPQSNASKYYFNKNKSMHPQIKEAVNSKSKSIENILNGKVPIKKTIIRLTDNLDYITGDGSANNQEFDETNFEFFLLELEKIMYLYDYIVIDVGAGNNDLNKYITSITNYIVYIINALDYQPGINSFEGYLNFIKKHNIKINGLGLFITKGNEKNSSIIHTHIKKNYEDIDNGIKIDYLGCSTTNLDIHHDEKTFSKELEITQNSKYQHEIAELVNNLFKLRQINENENKIYNEGKIFNIGPFEFKYTLNKITNNITIFYKKNDNWELLSEKNPFYGNIITKFNNVIKTSDHNIMGKFRNFLITNSK